ncbi:MAG: hypothetical protein FWH20_01580 [Oscillospiraceae bacterium]|nr:hypothetical protein [Oscillospiraceae bacterium]
MSISAVRSNIRNIQSLLSKEESINRELRRDLSLIDNGVVAANNTLENFNSHIRDTLDNSNDKIRSSGTTILDAYALQGEIERLYTRFKHVELANKKIREANNKKYYEFSNYRTVRKIVQGIMDNLDVNMVSDKTILKSVEIQHLQTPDYWLTCALISVMAWKNDDKELADRAMSRAIFLDKKRSSIFYMLFNLRMQREHSALNWFGLYQECEQTGSDQRTFLMLFSLVSKTLNKLETVDDNSRNKINEYINNIILESMRAEGYNEADIVAKIQQNYSRLQSQSQSYEQFDYALLSKHCKVYDDLSSNMATVKNNINILDFILKVVNVPVEQKNEFIKNYIDELISAPNQAEENVYSDIVFNELVIKLSGDIEAAKSTFQSEQKRAKNQINLISEMINWIFERENQEIKGQMRLNMFTLTKELQCKAVNNYTEAYRSRKTTSLPITINDYSTIVNFENESEECKKLDNFYTEKMKSELKTIKNFKAYLSFIFAVLAIGGAIFAGLYWDSAEYLQYLQYLLFVVAGICAISGFSVLMSNKSKRKQVAFNCKNDTKIATETLQKLFTEFNQYQTQFDEFDAYNDKILNELNKI